MQNIFAVGDTKIYKKTVSAQETATFDAGEVHPVYATFALAKDAEWACRLFVLEMRESDEEGIGTSVSVIHKSPAIIGEEVVIEATVKSIIGNEIICSYKATVADRVIATGEAGQKILNKEKLERIFSSIPTK